MREAFLVLQAEVESLRTQTERQDYLIAELHHALYGKKSEQLDPDARQLAFEDLETAVAESEAAADASMARNADGATRRPAAKRNLGHLPEHLPRIEEVIEPDHKVCPCGCTDMVKIGEDRAERLDIIPARFQVIVTIRPKYACRRCDASISQAATPHWLIEGGLHTEGTLAHVAVSNYADHLPLYRQCQIYGRGGVNLDRSTSATWCGITAYHLAPVVDRMLVHLTRSTRLFMNETRAPVLDPGAGKTKTGYLWVLTHDDRGWNGADPPAVVFTYPKRPSAPRFCWSFRRENAQWPGFESPFCALSRAVDLDDRAVNHRVFKVRILGQHFEHAIERIRFHPPTEAFEHCVPLPEFLRQVEPLAPCPDDPERSLDKMARVRPGPTGGTFPAKAMWRDNLPLVVSQRCAHQCCPPYRQH